MTGKKILIVCTTDSMIWNFLVPHIYALQDDGNIVECACSKTGFYMEELQELQKFTIHEIGFYRSPFHIYNLLGLIQLIKLIKSKNYDIIHCHEPVGGALGRIAGKICGKKIFYTAHGFHFFNGAPIINWIVYYPIEKFLARYTDVLITINQEDYSRAKKFKSKYVQYIPGIGIELKK